MSVSVAVCCLCGFARANYRIATIARCLRVYTNIRMHAQTLQRAARVATGLKRTEFGVHANGAHTGLGNELILYYIYTLYYIACIYIRLHSANVYRLQCKPAAHTCSANWISFFCFSKPTDHFGCNLFSHKMQSFWFTFEPIVSLTH